jgi:hypothetical protein
MRNWGRMKKSVSKYRELGNNVFRTGKKEVNTTRKLGTPE